jgi:HPr kinase/phosphorylase
LVAFSDGKPVSTPDQVEGRLFPENAPRNVITAPTIHASAVLVGARAVLIRGPAGSGKSRLALALIEAARAGALPFARLVADDRAHVAAVNGRVLVRPPEILAGLIEVRGLGVRRLPYEPLAVLGWLVDLAAEDAERLPDGATITGEIAGVALPRLAVAPGGAPLRGVLATIWTSAPNPKFAQRCREFDLRTSGSKGALETYTC